MQAIALLLKNGEAFFYYNELVIGSQFLTANPASRRPYLFEGTPYPTAVIVESVQLLKCPRYFGSRRLHPARSTNIHFLCGLRCRRPSPIMPVRSRLIERRLIPARYFKSSSLNIRSGQIDIAD